MANDAKLGLVLGVALVLVIALVFFRSDALEAKMPEKSSQTPTSGKKVESTAPSPQVSVAPVQP